MKKNIDIKIIEAKSFYMKLMGIMFKRKTIDYGILFYKVKEIHTFFCFQEIDIIMLDKNFNVVQIYNNIKPNKIIKGEKNVYYTLELPSGFISSNNIHNKDILHLTNLKK